MRFSERCEAMRAPTTEHDTIRVARVTVEEFELMKISPRVRPLRRARIRLATASGTQSRHSDQAIQAADRMLILPSPLPCSLACSVTTPHSAALPSLKRYEMRCEDRYMKREGNELPRIPYF